MKASDVRVGILRIEGTNCEAEAFDAFRGVGAAPELVHLNQLLGTNVETEDRRNLFDYDVLMLPGGFSAGDYVRAGAIFAARIKAGLGKDLSEFVKEGRPVVGVCNGFQLLVELGILPAIGGAVVSETPRAVLTTNDSNRFECRPVYLKKSSESCKLTAKYPKGAVVNFPAAHGEGKFLLPDPRQYRDLVENGQIAFRYSDPDGDVDAAYPWNPNGSPWNVAGVTNPEGNVLGLMPHPERVFHGWQHPDWTRPDPGSRAGRAPAGAGDGRAVFESVIAYASKKS
ncbi:MAG: phosphoribosylformylglycinamidine synthase subunit PurQ [Methanobacteriota archaeon]